jgi:ubiquinone/menaquinone biosynthesis C-methylase UbiE
MSLNDEVRQFWEAEACGTNANLIGAHEPRTRAWYDAVEQHRYDAEPFIHAVAQFTRYHGQPVLEVGVGAGTDHLQWARAGAHCFGVDLTDIAIETTRERLALYGFTSQLQRVDAEQLPFEDNSFDVVYSWGVIHHAEHPNTMVNEIHRVLKPNGVFIGMMYQRRSLGTCMLWLKHALLSSKPQRSLADVLWHHMESVGTKGYTIRELQQMFAAFKQLEAKPILTPYDVRRFPRWLHRFFPDEWGFFIALHAKK